VVRVAPGAALPTRETGLVFKAHRLLYHSTLGLREIKKRRRTWRGAADEGDELELVLEEGEARHQRVHPVPQPLVLLVRPDRP